MVGSWMARKIPATPASTDENRLAVNRRRSEMVGFRNVLWRSMASDVESMNRIAPVALSSAEKIEAIAHIPSQVGRSIFMAAGRARSEDARCGTATKAQSPRMAGTKANKICATEL